MCAYIINHLIGFLNTNMVIDAAQPFVIPLATLKPANVFPNVFQSHIWAVLTRLIQFLTGLHHPFPHGTWFRL